MKITVVVPTWKVRRRVADDRAGTVLRIYRRRASQKAAIAGFVAEHRRGPVGHVGRDRGGGVTTGAGVGRRISP
ncbi:MAG: hypothetical protein MZW92_47045 [Comamonadaceae bacterium]|nr:hypothetical protein [Comamonadaceae bacterium]